MHNDPLIKLEETEIPVVNEYKFLGVIFDWKLSFISHMKYLKTKTTHSQQLLRVVAHTKWGAVCQALLQKGHQHAANESMDSYWSAIDHMEVRPDW